MSPPGRHGAHAAGAVILAWISAATATSARAAALSGATATKGSPRSAAAASAGSKGTRPRRGMPASRASSAASGPDRSPAMFSTRPRTGAFTWLATVMAFLTTRCETSDGIVTTTVPARRSTSAAIVRSRSVPGGRSSSSRSSSPQLVSVRNSRSALASIEPRQVWASSWVTAFHWRGAESDGSSRSMDITLTPSDVRGGSTPPDARTRRWPRTPSIFAIVGPLRSASRTPTRRPACARQQARFAVSDDLPTPPLPDTIATTAWTVARRALSLRCWASTWATMFEPPSPAMSLYFFMRRLRRTTPRAPASRRSRRRRAPSARRRPGSAAPRPRRSACASTRRRRTRGARRRAREPRPGPPGSGRGRAARAPSARTTGAGGRGAAGRPRRSARRRRTRRAAGRAPGRPRAADRARWPSTRCRSRGTSTRPGGIVARPWSRARRPEPAAPLRPDLGQELPRDDGVSAPARIRLDRLDDHPAGEGRDRLEPLARVRIPRELPRHRQSERDRRGQLDDRSAVGPGRVAARGILREVVAVRRVSAAPAAATDLRELARPAAAAELRVAQVVEDRRPAPELGEARGPEVPRRHRHVGARRHVALGRDAAVVLPRGARAVGIVLEER